MLKTYPKCFVGSDCVKYLIESKEVSNVDEAIILGRMLVATNIIKHVEGDHDFKNEKLFYRFVSDEPSHGKIALNRKNGKRFSWSDFDKNDIFTSNKSNKSNKDIIRADKIAYQCDEHDTITTYKAKISPLDCIYNQQLLNNVRPKQWINPTPKGRYNLIAIGAGAAGIISASSCAGIGGKSAIIEKNLFGGDCLNHGCIPSKALLKCAKVIENAVYRGHEFGLKFVNHSIDFPAIMERMRKIRADISNHDACERFTKQYGLDVYLGKAEFVGKNRVKVGKHVLQFSRAVICTGAKPTIPPIPGLKNIKYLTHESIFNLTKLPERLGIIGAGPVGVEMAQAFSCFGSKVVVFDIHDRIMKNEDKEACMIIQNKLHKRFGVEFYFHCKINNIAYKDMNNDYDSSSSDDEYDEIKQNDTQKLKKKSRPVVVTIRGKAYQSEEEESVSKSDNDINDMKDEETIEKQKEILNKISSTVFVENYIPKPELNKSEELQRRISSQGRKTCQGYIKTAFNVMNSKLTFDYIFVCTGQRPNVQNMGLNKAGVKFNETTGIEVNDFLQTSNADIYAAGDCCSRYQYTHMADAMAKIVIRNALFFGRNRQSQLLLPWCTYTNPEIAHVGSYEKDLKQNGIEFDVYKKYLSENDRAICDGETEGFVKIITEKGTDKIIGATIVAEHAGDLISEISCCMAGNISLGKLTYIIHPYPTVAEGIKQCADAFNRTRLTPTTRVLMRKILSAKR